LPQTKPKIPTYHRITKVKMQHTINFRNRL
jgi:hypothetical protein